MRLAIISLMEGVSWGGSEALWHALAEYSLKQGDTVLISVCKWDDLHPKIVQLQRKGAEIQLRKNRNANGGIIKKVIKVLKRKFSSRDKYYREIINFRPDNVFINQAADFDFATNHKSLYSLLKKNNIPYSFVCHSHHPYSYIPPEDIYPGARNVFSDAQNVFFISERQRQLVQRKIITKLTNSFLTWNPLNIELSRGILEWPGGTTIKMAMVGVLDGAKGQDTAFEALSSPKWQKRDWILNIYGNGSGKKYLKDLASFYGISEKIIFHGFADNLNKVWLENHVLLLASSWEGMPISLLEAMACGRPVVAVDIGGVIEIVEENYSGFIAASPATHAFAAALEKAWALKSEWESLGKNAFEVISLRVDPHPEEKIYFALQSSTFPDQDK